MSLPPDVKAALVDLVAKYGLEDEVEACYLAGIPPDQIIEIMRKRVKESILKRANEAIQQAISHIKADLEERLGKSNG